MNQASDLLSGLSLMFFIGCLLIAAAIIGG